MTFQGTPTPPQTATPQSTALHRTAPHCTALHRTAPHCTALHRTAQQHCTALHNNTAPTTDPNLRPRDIVTTNPLSLR
jgi:hypothetical protein